MNSSSPILVQADHREEVSGILDHLADDPEVDLEVSQSVLGRLRLYWIPSVRRLPSFRPAKPNYSL